MTEKPKPSSTRKRGAGRPLNADSDATKAKIVRAARELMRKDQPSRISKADIARAAGVDSALLNYHFGDLSGVYLAVIESVSHDIAKRMALVPPDGSATERLTAYIKAWLDTFTLDPHFNELVVGEVFYGTTDEGKVYVQRSLRRVRELEAMVMAGIEQGEFRDIEPGYLYLSIVGLSEFFVTARPLVRAIYGERASMKRIADEYLSFFIELVLRGVQRRPA